MEEVRSERKPCGQTVQGPLSTVRRLGEMHCGCSKHGHHTIGFTLIFFFFCLFRATPAAHGSPQARGQIGAVATSLCHSQSDARSEPHL